MADKSGIQWTDATWNPVRGCSRVSAGCDNCYAIGTAHRFSGTGKPYEGLTTVRRGKVDWYGSARLHQEVLDQPLRWKKNRRIFVNSMSDLFHESLTNEDIDRVFGVMLACKVFDRADHTFQILTKRPERIRKYLSDPPAELLQRWAKTIDGWWHVGDGDIYFSELVYGHCLAKWDSTGRAVTETSPWSHCESLFPLPNVHIGVSVEDQRSADERIPVLLDIPASVRFVSAEPLLERVNICQVPDSKLRPATFSARYTILADLDWVIVGGESGPGARPCNVKWIREIVQSCKSAGVPVFVKQLGAYYVDEVNGIGGVQARPPADMGITIRHLKHKKGADPSEWPEDLRVREFPEMSRG